MFYNIKIKADGSEFILESSNKEITQREMDIYFSRIFAVSEEFKAQIKDVEIKSQNVISINEIDKHLKNQEDVPPEKEIIEEIKKEEPLEEVEPTKKIIIQEPIKAQNDCPVEAEDSGLVFEKEETIEPVIENKIEHIKNAPLASILIQNEPSDIEEDYVFTRQKLLYEELKKEKEKNDIITEEENQKRLNDIFASDISEFDEDIEDAVESAKQDADLISNEQNEQIQQNEVEFMGYNDEQEKPQEFAEEIVNEPAQAEQGAIQDIENVEYIENPVVQNEPNQHEAEISELEQMLENQAAQIYQPQEQVQAENQAENQTENEFENQAAQNYQIQEQIEPQKETQSIKEFENNFNDVDIIDLSTFEETNTAINSQVVSTEEIVSIREPIAQVNASETPDFKTYLEEFDTDSLVDDFLICAYYIKNILKQDGFTMKMINSKLFQATGKIADMSVVQELSNKEYISFVQDEISNKYFITPDGENYFQANFE